MKKRLFEEEPDVQMPQKELLEMMLLKITELLIYNSRPLLELLAIILLEILIIIEERAITPYSELKVIVLAEIVVIFEYQR